MENIAVVLIAVFAGLLVVGCIVGLLLKLAAKITASERIELIAEGFITFMLGAAVVCLLIAWFCATLSGHGFIAPFL